MRGNEKVIEQLNMALSAELTAIAQYMVQAEMCESWGYHRLAALTKTRAIKEMHHAEGLIERIIFLDGTPAINVPLTPKVGATVEQQLEFDYADEADAVR
ncbi:MAG: ferritin-like domain-containing protein, partial [Candidatus Korobacteraceae bacterium]